MYVLGKKGGRSEGRKEGKLFREKNSSGNELSVSLSILSVFELFPWLPLENNV